MTFIPQAFQNNAKNKNSLNHLQSTSTPALYRALYDYTPASDDELPLRTGALLHVTRICDDGWCLGADPTSGAVGTFPGNYVTPVVEGETAPTSGANQSMNYHSYFHQISKKSEP